MANEIGTEYARRKRAAETEFETQKTRGDRWGVSLAVLLIAAARQALIAIGTGHWLATGGWLAAAAVAGVLWRVARAREARASRLAALYRLGVGRVDGTATQSGHTGESFLPEGHLYSRDLDVLGDTTRGESLFGLLATTRTAVGQRALAALLLQPADAAEVRQRQAAVQELTPLLDLRERVALLGASSFEEIPAESYDRWLALETSAYPVWARPLLLAVAVAWAALLVLGWVRFGSVAAYWPAIETLLLAQFALCLWLRPRAVVELKAAKSLPGQTVILRRGLDILQASAFHAERLLTLQRDCAEQAAALKQLERWLIVVEQRDKPLISALIVLLCGGTHTAFALRAWKQRYGAAMARWVAVWAEFEALLAVATYAAEHAENVYPEMVDEALGPEAPGTDSPVFLAEALVHPLLPREQAVANDIALGADPEMEPVTKFLLISGSNMAGKSTLLRTLGANVVLGLAGAPVPARRLRMSALRVGASLALTDSLAEGRSKFLAEVERLRDVVALARERPGRCLFLIDEVFSGTNSADRRVAAEAVLRALVAAGALGALSTHDLALAELGVAKLGDDAAWGGGNVHMASPDPDDPLGFDYLLKPGVNRTTNALAIVKMMGLGDESRSDSVEL